MNLSIEIPFDEVQNIFDEETCLEPLLINVIDDELLPPEETLEQLVDRFSVYLSGSKMIQGTDNMV